MDDFRWQVAFPLRDVSGDGQMDVAWVGFNASESSSGRPPSSVLETTPGWGPGPEFRLSVETLSSLHFFTDDRLPLTAIIGSPQGWRLVALDLRIGTLGVFDLSTGNRTDTIPYPPPPSGYPQFLAWMAVFPAGDVNQDGWGDLFYRSAVSSYAVAGLIDGRSASVVWQDYTPGFITLGPVSHLGLGGFPDLNGDGSGDFVGSVCVNAGGQAGHSLRASSGPDGSTLWSRQIPMNGTNCFGAYTEDLDDDGVKDVLAVQASDGVVRALSGSTGSTLWSADVQLALPSLPPGVTGLQLAGTAFTAPRPGRSGTLQANLWMEYFDPALSGFGHACMLVDASNGALLDVVILPDDLSPWNQDKLEPTSSNSTTFGLGDVDRDGLIEVARAVDASAGDNPNVPLIPAQFAVLGQRTLVAPSSVVFGQSAVIEAAIPSGEGRLALLALSLGFDGAGGVSPAGWPTMFALDSLALSTLRNRPFLAVLGAGGTMTWTVAVPNSASLAGRSLYSRVIVPDVNHGGVYTHSSLGVTEIVP